MAKNNLNIENARLIFKNFSGKEDKYNREGDRNFCVFVDDIEGVSVDDLLDEGWNVKTLRSRDPEDEDAHYIRVKVRYDNYPPKIYMVTGRNKILLDEENVGELDYADIESVDLIISPYHYNTNGNEGITAYCKTMYVTIMEDAFAHKYDHSADPVDEDNPF